MKILFILKDNFPESGACTSLLKNILFDGGLAGKTDLIDVLAVKDKYTTVKSKQYDGIMVHNCVLMSRVSNRQYLQIFLKHPFKVLGGLIHKVISRLKNSDIDQGDACKIQNEIKKLDTRNYDVVVAVMGYFEVASAALKYKQKNPEIKLVLYQVDPCSSNKAFPDKTKKKRIRFERKLYEISDRIITTPILLKESKKFYPKNIIDKMIPMEFPNVVPQNVKKNTTSEQIRCVFAGNIYGDFRDPRYTLKLFDNVDSRISFEIIGSVKPELEEEFAKHKVLWLGPKSLSETKADLINSDVLVNIGNRMINQVPSKIFEYISYGKPIVNICKNRNCPTLHYLSKYRYVINLYEEDEIFEKQVNLLNDFILNNYTKKMSPSEIAEAFEKCTPQYCATQMLDVFDSL